MQKEEPIILSLKKTVIPKKIIGICGLTVGCGTTCISLAVSNYLCSKRKKHVAYVELNSTGQIHHLHTKSSKFLSSSREVSSKKLYSKDYLSKEYSYQGIHFFPEVTLSSLPEILQKDFEYFVLDMGILNPYTAYEFSRCHMQYMVGDFSLWKKEKTLHNLEQLIKLNNISKEQVILLENPKIKESLCFQSVQGFSRKITVPFISNPFRIASNEFVFYENMLGGK